MPTYYISASITQSPSAHDGDVLNLLREAAETAMCVVIEISAVGLIVECDAAALDVLEALIREELTARGGSLDRITAQRI